MSGGIQYLTGEDAPLVALWGDRWWTLTNYQRRRLRIQHYLSCKRPKDQQTIVAAVMAVAEGDDEVITNSFEKFLGINGWPK